MLTEEEAKKLGALTEKAWGWFYTADEERYFGPYASKEDAVQAAIEEECGLHGEWGADGFKQEDWSFVIARCQSNPFALSGYFDASRWLEDLADDFDYLLNEDGESAVDLGGGLPASLEKAVRTAIDRWQVENSVQLKRWEFAKIEPGERVNLTPVGGLAGKPEELA